MDSPGFFIIGFFGLFFVLWLIGGGPHKPISFSGPFITPITNINETQSGYGQQVNPNASVSLPGGSSVSVSERTTQPAQTTQPAVSQYAGKVTMSFSPESENAQGHLQIVLNSTASSPVSLRGWKFVSTNTSGQAGITGNASITAGHAVLVITSFPNSTTHDTITLYDSSGMKVTSASY